ncbi:DUF2161 family putative PD-(D/E)XK-type phosphodiesterase [Tritonibacter mobilis]|uniref:DUF2161 domain-containing phosphodiesterase n=1 Tax=Tritonibacter mobilis TaxID=379347 RepID=UPI001402EB88|nr:hypothetical protein [Tritonibacter mobilis]NHM24272.1 hypothetical protein [Tritonibacter mobilis]
MAVMEREQDLYAPVKALLEAQGYEVKGEVGAADVVAIRGGEAPVVVELKLRFSLSLFHQAITRLALSDTVYIAVPRPTGKVARRTLKDNLVLCRRLGLGLITVRADGRTEVHCDPGPYAPRKSKVKTARLLREFARIQGDPNTGGATRGGLMTGYRQDALTCALHLLEYGPARGADIVKATGIARATQVMYSNHYGWFERVEKGIYALTDKGRTEHQNWLSSTPEPAQPKMK